MHEGVPPGGPLVPELLAATNAALGNVPCAATIEMCSSLTLRPQEDIVVSVDGEPIALAARRATTLTMEGRAVRYVGLPGGLDVPELLGGRGALFVAHLGSVLRAGDTLLPLKAAPADQRSVSSPAPDATRLLRIIPGPDDFPPAVLAALVSSEFRVGPWDRVGCRLTGARLPVDGTDVTWSRPMVRGALQVTLDGGVIVLGPDHPTTGGYPVVATVVSGDQGALARRITGAAVRFTVDAS
jgi:allophanate hydrolase subunit 2